MGYVAKALLYGTVGLLAAGAVFGHGESTDTRGAMTKLIQAPFGRMLLAGTPLGLFGYAAWRCLSAFIDTGGRGSDAKGLAMREFLRPLESLAQLPAIAAWDRPR